jgi:hypothetical protein
MDPPCHPCGEPTQPISAVTVAVIVIIAIVVIYYLSQWLSHRPRDTFVSQKAQEVYRGSRELFDRTGGNATYSEYKTTAAPGTDAVAYSDIRSLWKQGTLTPEAVQRVL